MSNLAWDKMAQLCEAGFQSCSFKHELLSLCDNHEDIACVVYFHNRDNSLKWMKNKAPALKGRTPTSCFPSDVGLFKQVLLAFPC